jgi:hypothetical protein
MRVITNGVQNKGIDSVMQELVHIPLNAEFEASIVWPKCDAIGYFKR